MKKCKNLPKTLNIKIPQISKLLMQTLVMRIRIWDLFPSRCSIYATCTNAQGVSKPSETLEAQTSGHVPMAPKNPAEFVHPSNTSVRLDLFSWTSRICPIDYFIVSYRKVNVSCHFRDQLIFLTEFCSSLRILFCVCTELGLRILSIFRIWLILLRLRIFISF